MKKIIRTTNIQQWYSTITRVEKAMYSWSNRHNATVRTTTTQDASGYNIVVEVE